jgi:hypothetical protein
MKASMGVGKRFASKGSDNSQNRRELINNVAAAETYPILTNQAIEQVDEESPSVRTNESSLHYKSVAVAPATITTSKITE